MDDILVVASSLLLKVLRVLLGDQLFQLAVLFIVILYTAFVSAAPRAITIFKLESLRNLVLGCLKLVLLVSGHNDRLLGDVSS